MIRDIIDPRAEKWFVRLNGQLVGAQTGRIYQMFGMSLITDFKRKVLYLNVYMVLLTYTN